MPMRVNDENQLADTLDADGLNALLAAQREAFDHAFTQAPTPARATGRSVLALRIGGERFALRLEQVSALQRRERIVALPGCAPWVLGIVAVRGRLAPAYSLARLLGCKETADERWLVLHGDNEPLAFAFSGFDGLHTAPADLFDDATLALAEHRYTLLDLPALAASARALPSSVME